MKKAFQVIGQAIVGATLFVGTVALFAVGVVEIFRK